MTKHDRQVRQQVEEILDNARFEQVMRLMSDIRAANALPAPTHIVSERPQ